ncbi:uncharacterized protein N7529_011653 [Penicillium soppii]|uniref:uncharacterized protein n=1 Tax=Penicillium soppii TaxID=69789 RepID=UPI00254831F1|nr:uncharacterized protein N7529_011653 [Penicillium soppii]KAJ5852268.1 hypothetical protein N7529_011653 [Penicillium soppii]
MVPIYIWGCIYSILDDSQCKKLAQQGLPASPPPKARFITSMAGAVTLLIGLFLFPWIDDSSIHWIVCEIGTAIFRFSHVCIILSMVSYLVDSYTRCAASALAANAVIRALFGGDFPMFKTPMYHNLDIHWASSIPAFLAVACLPFLWIFYKLGFFNSAPYLICCRVCDKT